jgi:hypothetical protein
MLKDGGKWARPPSPAAGRQGQRACVREYRGNPEHAAFLFGYEFRGGRDLGWVGGGRRCDEEG